MRASLVILLVFVVAAFGAASKTLDIYVVDVEGGNATLFVSPSGESLLIDTGNGGAAAARDASRIMAAMKDAGVQQLDHLITTHWHGDHFGGMAELASHVTIKEFIDHGGNVQPAQAADDFLQKTYPALYAKAKHTVVKPGNKISIAGLDWRIVAAAGEHIVAPVPERENRTRIARLSSRKRLTTRRTLNRSEATSRSVSFARSTWAISPGTRNSI